MVVNLHKPRRLIAACDYVAGALGQGSSWLGIHRGWRQSSDCGEAIG